MTSGLALSVHLNGGMDFCLILPYFKCHLYVNRIYTVHCVHCSSQYVNYIVSIAGEWYNFQTAVINSTVLFNILIICWTENTDLIF